MNALTPILAVLSDSLTHFLIGLVVILIICGLVAYLVGKAPFIAEPWKGVIQWVLIAIPCVWVIQYLLTFV